MQVNLIKMSETMEAVVVETSPVKKVEGTGNNIAVAAEYDLSKFVPKEILQNNTRNKLITLLGHFPEISETDKAIVILEKRAFRKCEVFNESSQETQINDDLFAQVNSSNGDAKNHTDDSSIDTKSLLSTSSSTSISLTYFCPELKVYREFINNIYGNFRCTPPNELNSTYSPYDQYVIYEFLFAIMFV